MKQQVNLYKTLPHPARRLLGEKLVIQIGIGFVVLLGLVTLFQNFNAHYTQNKIAKLQKKYEAENAKLIAEGQAGGGSIAGLQQELALKTEALQQLKVRRMTPGCENPSNYFQALSSSQMDGVWLTSFSIDPSSGTVMVNGSTYEPLLILNWLKQLDATSCFSALKFSAIQLQKISDNDPKTADVINFKLDSEVAAPVIVAGASNGKA